MHSLFIDFLNSETNQFGHFFFFYDNRIVTIFREITEEWRKFYFWVSPLPDSEHKIRRKWTRTKVTQKYVRIRKTDEGEIPVEKRGFWQELQSRICSYKGTGSLFKPREEYTWKERSLIVINTQVSTLINSEQKDWSDILYTLIRRKTKKQEITFGL